MVAAPTAPLQPARRLVLWMLAPLLLVLSVSGGIAYYQAVYFAYSAYDQTLYDHAHSLAQLVEKRGKRIRLNMPRQAKRMFLWNDFDTTYYQITSKGKVVAGEDTFPLPKGKALRYYDTLIYDGVFKGTPVRAAELVVEDPELGQPVEVRVAQTQLRREQLTQKILLSVLGPQLVLILIVIMVVGIGVNRGLRPLAVLGRELDALSHQRLVPVPATGVPREALPLLRAVNDLLARLDAALGSQRKFVANAAHQLRTPLTAIRLNLDSLRNAASDEERQLAIGFLQVSVDRAIRLSRQLLTLARAEPEGLRQTPLEPLDLVDLARQEGMEWVPLALEAGVEISFEGPEHPVRIQGHATLLREAISNLIDNALKYGAVPDGWWCGCRPCRRPAFVSVTTVPALRRKWGSRCSNASSATTRAARARGWACRSCGKSPRCTRRASRWGRGWTAGDCRSACSSPCRKRRSCPLPCATARGSAPARR